MNDPIYNQTNSTDFGAAPRGLRYFWYTVVWFLILWTGALTLWLYAYSIRHGGAPCWDEFERCAWASHIWHGIRHFDLFHLWKNTNAQMVWPPLHSWMTGVLFVIFGPSLASARLLSLLAFWGSGLLIVYWFVRRRDYASCLGGAAAWSLFASAPIVVQQAVGVMSEGVGLFLALLVLASLPQAEDAKPSRWAWSGFLLGLFFYYKYNYAFLIYAGLGITRYFQRGASLRSMFCKANYLLFGIPILGMILWFIPHFEQKWQNLVYFAFNNPAAYQPLGFASFLYYPQVIPKAFFAAPWLAVASLALVFIATPLGWRLTLRNPVISCCIIHFIAVSVHPMKMERFQFITMGLFFIAAGEAVRTLAQSWFSRNLRIQDALNVVAALIILLPAVAYQSDFFRREQAAQTDVYAAPLRTAADWMKKEDRAALLITHDIANPPAATFYFTTSLDLLQRDLRTDASHWHHLFLFQPKDAVQAYTGEERIRHLRHELFVTRSNKIVVVETTNPQSSSTFPVVFAGVQEYINTVPLLPEWQLVFERNFPRAQANVRIYAMTQG
jgi:hypothetical protein